MMVSARVSRLLVLDGEGHLKGVVSLADLLVHESAGHALDTARGIYARETPDHPTSATRTPPPSRRPSISTAPMTAPLPTNRRGAPRPYRGRECERRRRPQLQGIPIVARRMGRVGPVHCGMASRHTSRNREL